ncbi:hypothetical protein chiPu_0006198 [Chiloscyllium punctatum]|uniref:Uncharacterized protein n=1 Tax=Chiloscyllium punctatum TaxID=137246 RepID=A0A401SBK3_CHIPU|nr:hypothetical protein [Chiloscyllium punctatum]
MAPKGTREVEQFKRILSMNWREEQLLQKRLSLLDSLKRQAVDSYSLDQRVLYRRFRNKLWRSELAHARLMGRRELLEQLRRLSGQSGFHTTVSDGSQAAVRGILQGLARSQAAAGSPSPPPGGGSMPGGAARGSSCCRKGRHPAVRPHTSAAAPDPEVAPPAWRPYTAARTSSQSVPRQKASRGERLSALTPAGSWTGQTPDSEPERRKSSNNQSAAPTPRESPLHIFLKLGEGEEKCHLLELHANLSGILQLEEKVKCFLQEIPSLLHQHSPTAGDYYSKRLRAAGAQSSKKLQLRPDLDLEPIPWHFAGKELHHRSMTFKKLDDGFCSSGCVC